MKRRSSAIAFATALFVPTTALAQDFPHSINEPPRGPGTEQASQYRAPSERVRPGWEAGVQRVRSVAVSDRRRGVLVVMSMPTSPTAPVRLCVSSLR